MLGASVQEAESKPKLRVAVLVSGGGTNLQAILDGLGDGTIQGSELALVVSSNPGAYALKRAADFGVDNISFSPKDFSDREGFATALLKALEEYKIDLIVLAGYLVVVPEAVVKKYRNRIINVHPSLIPSFCGTGYYGLKVHEAALERGVKLTGATVHFVDEGTDTGPILLQKAVEVKEGDTPESLQKRVMEEAEWKLLPQAINIIAKSVISEPQACQGEDRFI